ncbi:hypothetical protein SAMN05444422_11196 [Halobiforma haloterrestris]|uniref:Uncharacterized protein n=1 Tax=Natronobacterium haloterrestre TaxID=148448 RepID=A0A1I1KEZ0_NATHA|nr:hypothetical protein SAMN05444422_11196 [Halobiforma haloterrestris]
MRVPEPTDTGRSHRKLCEKAARYFEADRDTDTPRLEQTPKTIEPGTILYRTDAGVQQTESPSRAVDALLSELTSEIDDEADAVEVYVGTRATAGRLIEAVSRTELFRKTVVRIYVEEQGTYTRYVPPYIDKESRPSRIYTATLQLFIDEFLAETTDRTEAVPLEELYEQFCCWCRNVTATAVPSRPGFGRLLAAEGLETGPRGKDRTRYVLNYTIAPPTTTSTGNEQ